MESGVNQDLEELWDLRYGFEDRIGALYGKSQLRSYHLDLELTKGMSIFKVYSGHYRLYYLSWRRTGERWFEITGRKSDASHAEILDDMNQNHPALFEWILWHPI